MFSVAIKYLWVFFYLGVINKVNRGRKPNEIKSFLFPHSILNDLKRIKHLTVTGQDTCEHFYPAVRPAEIRFDTDVRAPRTVSE